MLCLILIFFLLDPKGSKNEATHKKGTFLFFFSLSFLFSFSFSSLNLVLCLSHAMMRHFPNVEKTKNAREVFGVNMWRFPCIVVSYVN